MKEELGVRTRLGYTTKWGGAPLSDGAQCRPGAIGALAGDTGYALSHAGEWGRIGESRGVNSKEN